MALQRRSQLGVSDREGRISRHHNQVPVVKLRPLAPKAFADQPLEPVPIDGPSGLLLGNRQTQAGTTCFVAYCQHSKPAVGGTPGTVEYTLEISRRQEAGRAGKSAVGNMPGLICPNQGTRRARPLARRAFKTLRPLRVAMRARKPWVRARLSVLGWKVLFME